MREHHSAASASAACPMHCAGLRADDMLALPLHKRIVVQYAAGETGATELRLYYGDKEISFDEPELFAFGEALAKQPLFRAGDATSWGEGYAWSRIKELFEELLDAGVLTRAEPDASPAWSRPARERPSPLPPASTARPRMWSDCEAITRELTSRPVELGHLELIIPIFRVAHIALDADGRQVGEANVFPRALRLDVPTDWMTCIYPGTRHMVERPMNASALKAMRAHWTQMMAALLRIRAAFLQRFPEAELGWTVGHIERLATLVLAVPTYQLMKAQAPVENGHLHPALSSLFRVTDGLRMVMHQMLFVPIGEPTLSPDAPITAAEIHDYAERNYSFHSETGVCAGPRNMVQEFLGVLLEARNADKYASCVLDPAMEEALADMDAAFDYGLYGLQAYAVVFSLWPIMSRTYERLAEIAETASADGAESFSAFRDRFRTHLDNVRQTTFLATESWRVDRERVYADMYTHCARGLGARGAVSGLEELIAGERVPGHAAAETALREIMRHGFGADVAAAPHIEPLLACLMDFLVREQAILRGASAVQSRINRLLGRSEPKRPFGSAEIDVHNLLQGSESRRLPYLLGELEEVLGATIAVDPRRIEIAPRASVPAAAQ